MEKGKPPVFRIKICGITNVDDATAVAGSGADAVGLNFYAKSVRFVEEEAARAVVEALPPDIVKVGLFVNAAEAEIRKLFELLRLDLIQLHGDEPPELIARLANVPVMKAFRVGVEGLSPVYEYIERCERLGRPLRAVLLDAFVKGSYGGTGRLADWSTAAEYATMRAKQRSELPPLVLAGGLTPENVASAIHAVRPTAVDTAGGVESSPGEKDAAAVRNFARTALQAFDSIKL